MDHISRSATLDTTQHRITCREHMMNVAKRMKNTPQCLMLYIFLMIVSVIIMLWEVTGSPNHWLLVVLETAINAFLILEVVIGVIALGSDYFHSLINCIDFGMTLLCILFYILFLQDTIPSRESSLTMVDSVLLGCRYLFQFGRLSILVYRGRKTTTFLIQADVDFSHHIDFDSSSFVDSYESTFDIPMSSYEMKPVVRHTPDCVEITAMVVKQYRVMSTHPTVSPSQHHRASISSIPSDTTTAHDIMDEHMRLMETDDKLSTTDGMEQEDHDTNISEPDHALKTALVAAHANCSCVCHSRGVVEKSIMVSNRRAPDDGL